MATEDHQHPEDLIKPGNEEYLSFYIYQRNWKPTKPIGEIGALNSSPGPAIVYLPPTIGDENHDPSRLKAPAFKLGLKDDRQAFACGPGPAAYDVRKKTNKGTDLCHAPKVGQKLEDLPRFRSPGPAAYHRGESDKCAYKKSPAFTMRPKTEPAKKFLTPAPASYTLPDTLGSGRSPYRRSPAFTMSERLDKTGTQQPNPGPAAYKLPPPSVTKQRCPAFSIRFKEKTSKIGTVTPGPASNELHMVKFNKPATPRFTFGIRHTPFEAFQRFAAES